MDRKGRMGLLRLFAETDEEYRRRLAQVRKAEHTLEELEQELTQEQTDAMWELISAHEWTRRYELEMACEYMRFPGETNEKNQR